MLKLLQKIKMCVIFWKERQLAFSDKTMPKQKQKNSEETIAAEKPEEYSSELREPRWSVVSFEKAMATGLSYAEAEEKLRQLQAEKVNGLCVVTDETAARILLRR